MERSSDELIKIAMLDLLRNFLTEFKLTNLKTILITRWNSEPNFRGSYSYRPLICGTMGIHADGLAQPVLCENGNIALQFAGEATNRSHYATVHGAIESGWRKAERIIDLYEN